MDVYLGENRLCYTCGQSGHMAVSCPSAQREQAVPMLPAPCQGGQSSVAAQSAPLAVQPLQQRPLPLSTQVQFFEQQRPQQFQQARAQQQRHQRGHGQTFMMSLEKAQDFRDVVTGTIFVDSFPAVALFDSGASYSFIYVQFMTHIGVKSKPLPQGLNILTGTGLVEVDGFCAYFVYGCEFPARLVEFPMDNFDVILGMDWLSARHAMIECYEGRVFFRAPGEEEFSFSRGDLEPPVISFIMKAVAASEPVQLPRVVDEFSDVFPNNHPRLPPVRDVEFISHPASELDTDTRWTRQRTWIRHLF